MVLTKLNGKLCYSNNRIEIIQFTCGGKFKSNNYLVTNIESNLGALVDVGLETEEIEKFIDRNKIILSGIVCTHGHFDHIGQSKKLAKKYCCDVYLHKSDFKVAKSSNFLMMAFGLDCKIEIPDFSIVPIDDLTVKLGSFNFNFIHTPGHTPGSCLIEIEGALFTGDTVYTEGIGLVNLPGESKSKLKQSILQNLDYITKAKVILPGHGKWYDGDNLLMHNLELNSFLIS